MPKLFAPIKPDGYARNPPPQPPARDLYIFHLQGCVSSETTIQGTDFLGNWEEDGFTFLFFSRPDDEKVSNLLKSQPHLTLLDNYHMTYEQWQGEIFSANKIGGFYITPPWDNQHTDITESKILLDPGLVFGTGTHQTTRDCLHALEWVWRHEAIRSVLDLGTGTGLLSLAAACLGSDKTLAVDKNRLATQTAVRNVELNRFSDRILVIQASAEDYMNFPADLVIANVHYEVMKNLIHADDFFNKKWYILSGLLRSQAKEISAQLGQLPVQMLNSWAQDGIWHTFCLKLL
jgi:ribosomal protein L11 methyltransferase